MKRGFKEVSKLMSVDLNRRFNHYFDESSDDFEPIYLTVTTFDPSLRVFVNANQLNIVHRSISELNGELVQSIF